MSDRLKMQDPRRQYPAPPFPRQPQPAPGLARKLEPPADHGTDARPALLASRIRPIPADPAALVERLTIAGLESTGVRVYRLPTPTGIRVKPEDAGLVWERDKVVVAEVLEITKHPDAEKLKLVKLAYGAGEPKTVVTGATNIAAGQSGMKVVSGLRGSRYFTTDKEGKKTIATLEPKALRGIMNDAMCMSNFELGISDEHAGIIILDDADAAAGNAGAGTPRRDCGGTRHPAEHGALSVDDRHRPRGGRTDRRNDQRSPNRKSRRPRRRWMARSRS